MKKLIAIAACTMPMVFASTVHAQDKTADTTKTAPAATTMPSTPAPNAATPAPMNNEKADMDKQHQNISGISVKKSIMGKAVYNEADEKVGDINDVVITTDGQAAYFVVGAGGFLGMGEHDVAIPYEKIKQNGDKLVLPGFTKDQLKALPKVEVKK
ncbi:PRC-barrel domain-containing protein [Pusillimonas sp. ANT_WB101]|uniref:PRC-barrel domain-containing protein n=1 Tax=Pusillimonas sp. ANT_WB101 TaxID=2597356 RepID=UPI0011EC7121|nr:PRC-barrel domain-containing protein [Pusillimonas sp. ANT_WB101]KAA0890802.1 PRC-barrel domain containing protein [Pusillimonas sp. ANT_WB101]